MSWGYNWQSSKYQLDQQQATGDTNSMIGAQSVLELLVVQSNLDGDGGVDQTDKSGRHSDEVGGSSVRRASVTGTETGDMD